MENHGHALLSSYQLAQILSPEHLTLLWGTSGYCAVFVKGRQELEGGDMVERNQLTHCQAAQ